ncbi:50S ribosomal protein L10 [Arsenophonus symbiont of Ornithomya chloropus]|uniref:50S ribosomal protein L10 n=1 Tax=Arsenophonus symbiont of Ornithomya chloropus TaxID=634121 RepID=UPI0032B10D1B
MGITLQDKKMIVAEISKLAKDSLSAVIANSCGISVNKITKLRKVCRKSGVYLHVVRNTLIYRAFEGTNYDCLKKVLVGPTLIAFSTKHPGAAARLFKEFIKENPIFQIKAAAFEGEFIAGNQIDRLASLQTYEEVIKSLILIMKEISIGKLIRIMILICDKKKR